MRITVNHLRYLDWIIVKPAISGFGLIVNLWRSLVGTPEIIDQEIKTIVIIKFYGLGSLVYLSGTVGSLRKKYPETKVVLLTRLSNKLFAESLGLFDQVYTIDDGGPVKLVLSGFRSLLRIWALRANMAVDAEFFTNLSLMVCFLTFAKIKVGYFNNSIQRKSLLTHHAYYNGYFHISRIFMELSRSVGGEECTFTYPKIVIPETEVKKVNNLLDENVRCVDAKYVAMNVNSGEMSFNRRWPLAYFVQLCNSIIETNPKIIILLIGAADERAYTQQLLDQVKPETKEHLVNCAGLLNIIGTMELIKRARLFVSNDSGPLHLASMVGTKTIAFFGPESPTVYGPKNTQQKILYAGLYCSPCLNVYNMKTSHAGNKRCFYKTNKCLEAIMPEDVIKAMKGLEVDLLRA